MTTTTKPLTKKATAAVKRSPRKKAAPVKVAPEPETIETVTLPAGLLASAWTNVALALSRDDCRPVLCSMAIEVYGTEAVRLVATDSYMLMHAFVSEGDQIPVDVEPLFTVAAYDFDKHALKLMRWLLTPRIRKDMERNVRLRLSDDAVIVDVGDATALLEVTNRVKVDRHDVEHEQPFPNWRGIVLNEKTKPQPTTSVSFSSSLLARVCRIKADTKPILLEPSGALGPMSFTVKTEPPVYGLVMPVRT